MKNKIRIYQTNILIVFLFSTFVLAQPFNLKKSEVVKHNNIRALTIVALTFIDPGIIPFSGYRWRDVAGNLYAADYRTSYSYDDIDVQVQVTFEASDLTFNGEFSAINLKPNFAYQLKISGSSGSVSNELIGLTGRWWQEEWDGSQWTGGRNLNNKGNGSSPNPNDDLYFLRRDETDPSSPTGLNYRFTGYLVLDYFITDENGDALFDFEANSSYHVLWNTIQRSHTTDDGPAKSATFDPDPAQTAYDKDYPQSTMTIFGEWERLPVGEIYLAPGAYDCQIILTEESFHSWPTDSSFNGQWASVMSGDIHFDVEEDNPLAVELTSFSAEADNFCVLLSWITESEINHAGFEILRSSHKDKDYFLISSYQNNPDLMGQGSSSVRNEYLYSDHDVVFGQSYWYQLIDVDLDGIRTVHGPVSVHISDINGVKYLDPNSANWFILYPNFPNPFNSSTTLRFDIPQIRDSIEVKL
jgi:hypothetical protein